MSSLKKLQNWWQEKTGEEETPFDGDSSAFFASLLFHMLLLIVLGLVPFVFNNPNVSLTIAAPMKEEFEELDLTTPKEFASSPLVSEDIGANSVGDVGMAMSLAQIVSEVSVVPSPTDLPVEPSGEIAINNEISVATGLNFSKNLTVKGATGEGVTGAVGAIDRLTQEILRSLEERKTLVVWLFDQSPSLSRERAAINERFDRIYEELGVIEASGNPAFAKHEDKPLLTSVMSFGQEIKLLTKQPTDNLQEIKAAVAGMAQDESGVEKIFSAVYLAADRFKPFRIRDPVKNEPERNVLLVAFTDERGDDLDGLDQTISMCRRYAIPVYVVGVPAPFGQEETYVKWIDPDPSFDQTPQWGRVNQGPETLVPRADQAGFWGRRRPGTGPDGFGIRTLRLDSHVLRNRRHLLLGPSQPQRQSRSQPRRDARADRAPQVLLRSADHAALSAGLCAGRGVPAAGGEQPGSRGLADGIPEILGADVGRTGAAFRETQRAGIGQRADRSPEGARQGGTGAARSVQHPQGRRSGPGARRPCGGKPGTIWPWAACWPRWCVSKRITRCWPKPSVGCRSRTATTTPGSWCRPTISPSTAVWRPWRPRPRSICRA